MLVLLRLTVGWHFYSEGIDKTIDQEDIEIFKKQKTSLMPQDLQKLLTVNQLINLVEYTLTLKKTGD